MNPRNPIDFIQQLARIELSSGARTRIREAIVAYADLHTAPETVEKKHAFAHGLRWMFSRRATYVTAVAFVLVVATGTQATLAAEHAIPGDILYPVKVSVAEPVALALTTSGEKKAKLATRFASRRVQEASVLSAQGKLDEKTATELAVRFDTHVDLIAKETATIEAKGDVTEALAVRTDLEQDLTDTAKEFDQAEAPDEDTDKPEDTFTAHISARTHIFGLERERLEAALSVQVASTTEIDALEDSEDEYSFVPEVATSTATSTPEKEPEESVFKTLFFKDSGRSDWSTGVQSGYAN